MDHLIIRASAGTGKTFQLSNRFLALLRGGVPVDTILATTFTRKAANEILDRVLSRLAEAVQDAGKRRELAKFTGGEPFSAKTCLSLLRQVVLHLHRLRICTLDSFFAQIARSFSLEMGLPPAWRIIAELDDAGLRSEAIESVLRQGEVGQLKTLLNLLAKGESTRGISAMIHDTVDKLYDIFQETQAAAWHALPRTKPLSDAELAAAVEQLRAQPVVEKRMADARNADCDRAVASQWDEFLATGLAKKIVAGETAYYKKPIPDELVAGYERLIDHAKALLVGRVANQTEATFELLTKFHSEYQRLKQASGEMRFDDIPRRLAARQDATDASRLAFRLDAHVEHLLLDEFQDTSPAQWNVVRPFAEQVTATGENTGRSFFCVGDVKQAIYGWRGGVAEIFDLIEQQLPGLTRQRLNKSYRSSPAVIETVNRVFHDLQQHPNLGRGERGVEKWCDRFDQHETARTDLPGFVQLETAPRAGDDEKAAVVVLEFAAARIAKLVEQAPGCSFGVLTRTNESVGKLIYNLQQLGVAASEEGGNPLTDSAAVQLVLSLLHLADHPGDTVARFHLATSPAAPWLELPDESDDDAALRLSQRVRDALAADGYGLTIYDWVRRLAGECSRRELARLEQLVELAFAYQADATLRADDFVAFVESQRVADVRPAAVRVMTIHRAKGLEFDIVVLPELHAKLIGLPDEFVVHRPTPASPADRVCRYTSQDTQRLLPPAFQKMFDEAVDAEVSESLCVLYVALTRAVHALHMIIPPSAENERSLPKTFAGLLRQSLHGASPVEPETVLFHCGDPRWFEAAGVDQRIDGERRTDAQVRPKPSDGCGHPSYPPDRDGATVSPEPLAVPLAPSSGERRRGWRRASPSGLEGGGTVDLHQRFAADRTATLFRGTLIHAWFEQIDWLDDGPPTDTALRAVARSIPEAAAVTERELDGLLAEFTTMLAAPAIAGLLRRDRYRRLESLGLPAAVIAELRGRSLTATVQNERAFAIREDGLLLSGFIDRLVLLSDGDRPVAAEIIDFKTDLIPAGEESVVRRRVENYEPQLQAYRRAVARLTGLPLDRIAAQLAFVSIPRIEPIRG